MLAATRGGGCSPLVVLVAVCGLVGVLARDWALTRELRARESRMLTELPTIAELLALAVGAGEGAVGALERVVRIDARRARRASWPGRSRTRAPVPR